MKDVIAGVSLAQYAAVTAALAEAFPLRAVLTVERLSASQWAEADRDWTQQLDQDPSLLARYEAERAAARDRLFSRDDLADGNKTGKPLLAGKARLVRSGRGLPPAPTVNNAAAEAMSNGAVAAMSNAAAAASGALLLTPTPPAVQAPEPPLPLQAVLPPPFPPLPEPPPLLAPILATPGIDGPRTEQPVLPNVPPPLPPRDPDAEEGATLALLHVPSEVRPFRSAPSTAGPPPPLRAPPLPPRDPDAEEGATLALLHVPSEVRPFRSAPSTAGPPPPLRAPPLPPRDPDAEEGATLALLHVPSEVRPFRSAPSTAGPPPPLRAPPLPPRDPDAEEGATLALLHVPSEVRPFRSAPSTAGPPPPLGPSSKEGPRRHEQAALPAAVPRIMPLKQHASLCLEIALDPTRAGEAIARYRVTEAEKIASDEHYRARIAVDPELGAEWRRAYNTYHEWLRSRSRR